MGIDPRAGRNVKPGRGPSGTLLPPTLRSKPPTEYPAIAMGRNGAKATPSAPRACSMLSR